MSVNNTLKASCRLLWIWFSVFLLSCFGCCGSGSDQAESLSASEERTLIVQSDLRKQIDTTLLEAFRASAEFRSKRRLLYDVFGKEVAEEAMARSKIHDCDLILLDLLYSLEKEANQSYARMQQSLVEMECLLTADSPGNVIVEPHK